MLVQMVTDVQSYLSQAKALNSESKSAWTAYSSAADARRQAERALREVPADPVLQQRIQLAKEDEGRKQEHYQEVQERLATHSRWWPAIRASICAPSEPSALLLYQRLPDSLWASICVNA